MAVVNRMPELLDKQATLEGARAAAAAWVTGNSGWLTKLMQDHQKLVKDQQVELYQATYDGDLEEIDQRDKSRGDDVNHKLMASYAQLLIDTPVDYLLGNPIVWSMKDPKQIDGNVSQATLDEYRKELLQLLENEDAQRVLREMLTQGSVTGMSYVIGWVDESGNIDYEEFPYQEIVPVYDTRGRLRLVVRFYQIDIADPTADQEHLVYKAEIYDTRYVISAIGDDQGENFTLDPEDTPNIVEHKAGRIPVAIFRNGTPARYSERKKKAGVSDLAGGLLSLIVEYAESMSDKANAVDRMQDQLLKLKGVQLGGTKDEAQGEVMAMRKARAIALKSVESDAEYIQPAQEDGAVENFLDRTKDTMYELGGIPKLGDLSGATATEIKVKYAGLDIKAGKKETYLRGTIKQLLTILTDFINARKLAGNGQLPEDFQAKLQNPVANDLYSSDWIDVTINRNVPQNFLEIAQIVATLSDKVPDSYLYELLWFVSDPKAALDEMKKQKDDTAKRASQANLDALGLGGEFSRVNNEGTNQKGQGEETGME
ncbi:phage portal protein [Paenibacillus sp. BK720]|uniref:phage portal protein n=1 Tax=Paenibacillus sp. BK720 TaxID=2587092 RepID=UPI001424930B|nr:phage portal protein [Paenibacillus sp. BK720]NIK67924.1 SPP1 family phage portal protein [Paenibacillus sp. BK720]